MNWNPVDYKSPAAHFLKDHTSAINNYFPDQIAKVLNRVRSLCAGKLNNAKFDSRMRGESIFADRVESFFTKACRPFDIAFPSPFNPARFFTLQVLSDATFETRSHQ